MLQFFSRPAAHATRSLVRSFAADASPPLRGALLRVAHGGEDYPKIKIRESGAYVFDHLIQPTQDALTRLQDENPQEFVDFVAVCRNESSLPVEIKGVISKSGLAFPDGAIDPAIRKIVLSLLNPQGIMAKFVEPRAPDNKRSAIFFNPNKPTLFTYVERITKETPNASESPEAPQPA